MVAVSLKKIFFQAEDGIRDYGRSRGLGDVYKRQIERLKKINNELISLKDKQAELGAKWKKEKDEIDEISTLKEEIESVQFQIDQAKRSFDLNKAAEFEFGTLNSLQKKLKEKSDSLVNSQKNGETSLLRQEVTFDDIAEFV